MENIAASFLPILREVYLVVESTGRKISICSYMMSTPCLVIAEEIVTLGLSMFTIRCNVFVLSLSVTNILNRSTPDEVALPSGLRIVIRHLMTMGIELVACL
jgi:hypothetical protein